MSTGFRSECRSCGGTGLYKGFAEKDGAAVICTRCKGKGYVIDIHGKPFTGLKIRHDVSRVFLSSFGYVHTDQDFTCYDGQVLHFSRFGCSYTEWLNGENPKPMEELYCPKDFDGSELSICGKKCSSDCPFFPKKEKCWKEWHEKHKT